MVAVFALPRSTGAAGLGTADAAEALAIANPEIIDKTSSVNCPLAKNSVLLHFLLSYSFIIPLLLHTTILKHLVIRKYRKYRPYLNIFKPLVVLAKSKLLGII